MKIIFLSPFNPLWSEDLEEMSNLLSINVISIGQLLRDELNNNSSLGRELDNNLKSGEILDNQLVNKIVVRRFFIEQEYGILTGVPINSLQAIALAREVKAANQSLDAVLIVDISLQGFKDLLVSRSYNLESDKASYLIDSYFDEDTGVLAAANILCKETGARIIHFSSIEDINNIY